MRRRAYSGQGPVHLGAARDKALLARALRSEPTQAERVLWSALRRRGCGGFRFRRQHPLAGYVVDFYCAELRLAVEVDGPIHQGRLERDHARDRALERLGVAVVRVTNAQVFDDCNAVGALVLRIATGRAKPLPPPKRGEGRGGG